MDLWCTQNVPPATTFSLIQELIHRDGLRTALAGRDDVLLEPILRLLLKHVADPRFGEMVCDVSNVVIGEQKLPPLLQNSIPDMEICRNVHSGPRPVATHRYPLPPSPQKGRCRAALPAGARQGARCFGNALRFGCAHLSAAVVVVLRPRRRVDYAYWKVLYTIHYMKTT